MISIAFTFIGAGIFALTRLRDDRVPQEAVIGLVYGTATIHRLPLDELKERAAWIFSKYVDAEGVRQRLDPMPVGAAVAVEVKADKIRTWHP